jgi:hypothetical protein
MTNTHDSNKITQDHQKSAEEHTSPNSERLDLTIQSVYSSVQRKGINQNHDTTNESLFSRVPIVVTKNNKIDPEIKYELEPSYYSVVIF